MKLLKECLYLHSIPRWGIIDVSRPQNVAEHTYRTMAIAKHLVERIYRKDDDQKKNLTVIWQYLFYHDLPEVLTGDIPSTIKDECFKPCPKELQEDDWHEYRYLCKYLSKTRLNELICKLADLSEAAVYLSRYGIGSKSIKAIRYLKDKIMKLEKEFELLSKERNDINTFINLPGLTMSILDMWSI